MKKTISSVGTSAGIPVEGTLTGKALLRGGDELDVQVHAVGAIAVVSIPPCPSREQVTTTIKSTLKGYNRTMKRLA